MKKILKWGVIVVVAIVIIGILLGKDDLLAVEFDYEISVDEEVLEISGETNLKDGTLISYEVDNYETTEYGDEGAFGFGGDMEVNNGEFNMQRDVSEHAIDGHIIEVWIGFRPTLQPEEIQEEYGTDGGNITGDLVEEGKIDIVETFDFQ